MITPPRRTALGTYLGRSLGHWRDRPFAWWGFGLLAIVACGDPNDPASTGTLAGVVRDADTDAPIEGVSLVVAGVQGQTGSDGQFEIGGVPAGTQQVAATMAGYLAQTVEAEIRSGGVTSLSLELTRGPGAAPPTVTTAALPSGTVDVPYDVLLEASGGTPPYQWALLDDPPQGLESSLPPGLTVDEGGSIVGTPAFPAGSYPVRIQVTDANAKADTADLTLEIGSAGGLRLTSVELNLGEAQQPYADTLTATGGAPPYQFEWLYLYELGGLTLDAATGVVSGIPGGPTGPNGELREAVITVRDVVGASAIARVTIGIRPAPLVIVTDLPDGRIDEYYRVELMREGGAGGETWTVVSGTLPPGLGLSKSMLYGWTHLEGQPTALGSYSFTLQVSTSGIIATREYTVVIADPALSIVTSSLPPATVGEAYSAFLVRQGGTGPFQWDVVSGSLPGGISLTAEGELTGTPTAPEAASFEVRVRDAGSQSATATLTLQVEP